MTARLVAIGGTVAALAVVGGAYTLGTTQTDTVQAQFATQSQPFNMDEVCSAISEDSVSKFRASGVISVPKIITNSQTAEIMRSNMNCDGELVTGAEANRRLCSNLSTDGILSIAQANGVIIEGDINAAVDQTRDVFNCNSDADFPPAGEAPASSSESASATTTTEKAVAPSTNGAQNPVFRDVDPDEAGRK